MLRFLALVVSVLLTANVVGLCIRVVDGTAVESPVSQAASGSSSQGQPQSSEGGSESGGSSSEEGSSPYEDIWQQSPSESSESSSGEASSPQQETAGLPDVLTPETLLELAGDDSVRIYCSANGKTLEASVAAAKTGISAAGVESMERQEPAAELSPTGSGDYISITCGDYVFYIYKKYSQAVLTDGTESAYYKIPSGLYTKIYYAMMFA